MGLCFHTAGENVGLPNMGDTWCQDSIKETFAVLRSKGAGVLNKTPCYMIKISLHKKHVNLDLRGTDKDKAFF